MTPTILCTDITITAAGHWSEVALPPYLNIIIIIIILSSSLSPDSVLRLQGEQKAGGEAVDVVHTVHVLLWLELVEVPVVEG